MDYEVFVVSRIREEYARTKDAAASVVEGVAHTGRVVSAAAIIMVTVFGCFVIGDDPIIKMFGLGLSLAVALDAFVVRLVLVPALMKLMGDTAGSCPAAWTASCRTWTWRAGAMAGGPSPGRTPVPPPPAGRTNPHRTNPRRKT
ncbi:MMPL family transporter [Streptomyces sp. NPDC001500]